MCQFSSAVCIEISHEQLFPIPFNANYFYSFRIQKVLNSFLFIYSLMVLRAFFTTVHFIFIAENKHKKWMIVKSWQLKWKSYVCLKLRRFFSSFRETRAHFLLSLFALINKVISTVFHFNLLRVKTGRMSWWKWGRTMKALYSISMLSLPLKHVHRLDANK